MGKANGVKGESPNLHKHMGKSYGNPPQDHPIIVRHAGRLAHDPISKRKELQTHKRHVCMCEKASETQPYHFTHIDTHNPTIHSQEGKRNSTITDKEHDAIIPTITHTPLYASQDEKEASICVY